jgi:NADPH2:quinone reductase
MPEPGAGEVRVRIHASGVNPSDVKRRDLQPAGSPAEFPVVIPHNDGAGVIDAAGAGVSASRVGERVWVFNAQYRRPSGTAAEYCVVPDDYAITLPDSIDFDVGAGLGVPALTAYHAIHIDGSVAGLTLLVQGGAGVVGHYAIQFAKAAGARVITTVSSDAKAAHARAAGADLIVNYRTEDLVAAVRDQTQGRGVDRVIEINLTDNVKSYPALLAEYGKAVVYGAGKPTAVVPTFIPRSLTLQYFVVYRLRDDERRRAVGAVEAALRGGSLKHTIADRVPLDEIVRAHEIVERDSSIGKTVVIV